MAEQPTITSKNLQGLKNPVDSVVEIPDSQIEARPLTMPGFASIKPKNPNLALRWVNFVVNRGQRLSECQALGYRTATKEDVDTVPGGLWLDGAWKNGDLLLMCMAREKYIGAIKFNEEASLAKASRAGVHKKAEQDVRGAAQANLSPGMKDYAAQRVKPFTVSEEDAERVMESGSESMIPLPEGLYGANPEGNPRIVDKSKAPLPNK